jgi:hypothetical protein
MPPVGLLFMSHLLIMMLNLSVYLLIVVHVSTQLTIKVILHLNGHVKQAHEMYLLILKVKAEKNSIHHHPQQPQIENEVVYQNLPHPQNQKQHLFQMIIQIKIKHHFKI